MTRIACATAVFALCATLLVTGVEGAAPAKRSVDMEITLPKSGAPRVRVKENEGAVVTLPDGRRFGFVPTIRDGGDAAVVVVIWDVNSALFTRLGQVDVEVGGPKAVQSDTTPSFGIRILRIIQSK
jgi:hypothetical protein